MKYSAALIAFLLGSTGIAANAQPYVSGNVGLGMLETSDVEDEAAPGETASLGYDNSFILSGAVGYTFDSFRGELELAYQKNDIDTFGFEGTDIDTGGIPGFNGDVSSLTGLINGYFDFDLGTSFRPYLTAGLGLSKVDFELSIDSDLLDEAINESADDSVIAYHLGAGFGYAISENVILDLRYRYFMTDEPDFDGSSVDYTSHNITGGIRINF